MKDTQFFCTACLEKRYYNEPRKKQDLARCHGCDDVLPCSEFETSTLKSRDQEDLLWQFFGA